MISYQGSIEKMIRTHLLGAPIIEMFHANKMAHFTCYFEPYLYKPENVYMGCFKYVKMF